MINTFFGKLGQSVYLTELFDYLELTSSYYSRFITKEVLNNPYAVENQDYCRLIRQSNKSGRYRNEFEIHIDFAKKICMVSKSKVGGKPRNELVELTKKIESGDIITVEQAKIAHEFVNYFRYVENQKLTKDELLKLISKRILLNNPNFTIKKASIYAQSERNKILDTSKELIFNEYIEFCINNGYTPKTDLNITQMTFKYDRYLLIYYAVIDFLLVKGYTKPYPIADFIYTIAKKWDIEILPVNETNLFQQKLEINLQYVKLFLIISI